MPSHKQSSKQAPKQPTYRQLKGIKYAPTQVIVEETQLPVDADSIGVLGIFTNGGFQNVLFDGSADMYAAQIYYDSEWKRGYISNIGGVWHFYEKGPQPKAT